MAAKWLVAFTLLAEVKSPPLQADCDDGEYVYSGICYKYCPSGTYVEEYCSFPNTLGMCKSCTDGVNYTEYDNLLDYCLPCTPCDSGFKMVIPCTTKKNTVCQCNDGYFCPPGCQECVKCNTRCPKGEVIVQSCSATMDMKCGPPPAESSASLLTWLFTGFILLLLLLGVVVLLLLYCCWCKDKWRKPPPIMEKEKEEAKLHLIPHNNENANVETFMVSRNKLPETAEKSNVGLGTGEENASLPHTSSISPLHEVALSNEQSNVLTSNKLKVKINNPSFEMWEDTYFQIKNMIGQSYWNPFMRKCGLSDNDIEKIMCDYHHQTDEQYYQMLKTLRDRNGGVNALYKIIIALQEMSLQGIYENLINELKSKDIITIETED